MQQANKILACPMCVITAVERIYRRVASTMSQEVIEIELLSHPIESIDEELE